MSTRSRLAAAAAALLGACAAPRPADVKSDVPLPARWQAPAAAQGAAVRPDWWSDFGSAELNGLMAQALAGNRDLRAASSRIAQARAVARIAGSALLPSVDATVDVARERSGGRTSTTHQVGLAASLDLDPWGRFAEGRAAAERRVSATVYDRDAVALALQAEVAATYFRLLSAQDRLAVARRNLDVTESILRLFNVQRDAGALSRLEVVRQQGLVSTVRATIAPLEQQREQAADALAVLLGRPVQELTLAGGSLEALRLPAVGAGLPSALLLNRPDIRRAEADLAAAQADVAAARAALLPSIRLTAAGGVEAGSLASLVRSGSVFHTLAASLVAPIFEGGRLRGQVALEEARREELVQAYAQSILTALREVEDDLVALQRLAEQAAQQQDVVAQANTAMELAELRYRNGAADFATVLDAQRVQLDAVAGQHAITLARYASTVDLFRALGGGWTAGGTQASTP